MKENQQYTIVSRTAFLMLFFLLVFAFSDKTSQRSSVNASTILVELHFNSNAIAVCSIGTPTFQQSWVTLHDNVPIKLFLNKIKILSDNSCVERQYLSVNKNGLLVESLVIQGFYYHYYYNNSKEFPLFG